MKKLILILVALISYSSVNAQYSPFFKQADAFLKKYVSDGLVDYNALKSEPGELEALVNMIMTEPVSKGEEEKAFLINAYNILSIRMVVESMPIDGPREVYGFFEKEMFEVHNERTSLNKLEKEMLYAKFTDPRLHLVLVCAAKGCPKLAARAYMPDILDAQLDEQASEVMNTKGFTRIDSEGKLQLSSIFEWYLEDFKRKGDLMEFVLKYYTGDFKDKSKYSFYDYDWSLNIK
ncbi:MAG: hypothetical protein ACI9FU_001598 [Granulosicoccus sp.]|jgi:hypothetical protein